MINGRIEINPEICAGKAVVNGTRITVSNVLSYLAAGDNIEEVLAAYPQLSKEDVLACLDYAVKSTDHSFGVSPLS